MGEAAKKDDEEEKFIAVGPGADELPEADKKADESEDERLAQKSDEDEEPHDGKGAERRKETSKERRERARKANARQRLENEFLLKRNEELEKRFMALETRQSQTEVSAIDQRINTLNAQLATARRVISEAAAKPNGSGAAEHEEALKIYDELRDALSELKVAKKHQQQHVEERRQATYQPEVETPKPDPRVIRNARKWASKHDWFSFDGEDEDSRIVRAIDEALSADGFDPTDEEYWDELTARVKARLPEKFKKGAKPRPADDEDDLDDEDDEREVRSTGPKFSSGGRERPLKKGEVYVSAERKQAMKEYGVWDDPVARNRMLKKYAQWDAEVASNKR